MVDQTFRPAPPNTMLLRSLDHRLTLIAVLAIGLAARGLALWKFSGQLQADADGYRAIAESLVAGRGFGFPEGSPNAAPSAYRPPLYPCLLTPLVLGASGNQTTICRCIGALHLVLGAGTIWLTILAARRLGLRRAGVVAGLLVAIDPLLVYNASLVMTETTAAFLAALWVWLLLRAAGPGGRFAAGAAFGLCCLCRPTFWACGAILAALGTAFGRRRMELRHVQAVVVGAALVVAPWAVRNTVVMGRPVLTTTHGGYTLLLAHNPFYTREVVDRPWGAVWSVDSDHDWQAWLEDQMQAQQPPIDYRQPHSPAIEIARDRWMSRRAWQYIDEEPATAVRAGTTLLARFWNIIPLTTESRSLPRAVGWMIGAFYIAEFAALLVGMWRIKRGEWSCWWPLFALLAGFTAVHALYWADMRMRAPLVPAMALLAARSVQIARDDEGTG